MKPDPYTKAVLIVIALLLGVVALRPIISPTPVHATSPYKYTVTAVGLGNTNGILDDDNVSAFTKELKEKNSDGWELVSATPITYSYCNTIGCSSKTGQMMFIFRK